MAVRYPSDAWIKQLQEVCNADPEFRKLGAHFTGKFIFRIEAEPGVLEKDVNLFCWPDHGVVKESAELASAEHRPDVDYIVTGSYRVWKDVVQGRQEPLRALMTRKLKLIKGKQLKLLKEVKLALKLINACKQVDATFPDETA